jgi:hypothetical protein
VRDVEVDEESQVSAGQPELAENLMEINRVLAASVRDFA